MQRTVTHRPWLMQFMLGNCAFLLAFLATPIFAIYTYHLVTPDSWGFLSPEALERLRLPATVSACFLACWWSFNVSAIMRDREKMNGQ